MVLLAVVLVSWVLLTLPVAVLMGKCIAHGLAPSAQTGATVAVPEQRSARESASFPASAHAGRSQA